MGLLWSWKPWALLAAGLIVFAFAAAGWSHHIYRCTTCGAKFVDPDDLVHHQRTGHRAKQHTE